MEKKAHKWLTKRNKQNAMKYNKKEGMKRNEKQYKKKRMLHMMINLLGAISLIYDEKTKKNVQK